MDSDASQMEDQSEARADAPDSHADAPGSRADVPNSRAVSRSIFQSDFVGGLTIGAIYLIYHLPSISRFLYRLPGRAIMGLTWFAFGTFFRLVAFTPLLFGKRPVGYTGFCYLLLFPFYSRWLAALRLGAFPTGASLRNYIQDSMSKTYNGPSQHWEGLAGSDPESDKAKRIQRLLSSANFEYLKSRGIESRRRHQLDLPDHIKCSINLTQFASGFNNLVLEVAFSDNVYWIARIPHQVLDDGARTSMLSEIATMKIIQKHTTIPIPRVFDFEVSADQPFGYPYVLMEFRGGRMVPNSVATDVPPQDQAKVAKQLANVFVELQNLTFSRIGRLWCGEDADQPPDFIPMDWHSSPGPLDTSLEYFYNQRQGENREIMAMHPGGPDWLTACWVLKNTLTHIIIEDRVRGPLSPVAQAAPLEQLSVCPEFATFPLAPDEENRPIVELKNLVIDAIREMERGQAKKPPLDNPEAVVTTNLTPLSTYMASQGAEVTYRQYMASPRASLGAGKLLAKIIYGDSISWGQLREVYGTMPVL
ncbi:hypothetical protein NM208_g2752 [Fusarium decemcellulare]|uniref:Uncharacterized protein n=1 Tax=Fusarium decemcellulare TaxID=57161 RepID=A0ACC1SRJ1_9HYPO|nr:hypothetical protein NM208_g2752 [Fusarium decemcellulare]